MTEKKPNILVRLLRGIWGTFNFVRRFVFGVIALLLLLGFIAALGGTVPLLQDKTALVIAPEGFIVEQYSSDPVDRALSRMFGDDVPETQLRDILRALDAAARDPHIARVVIIPDRLMGAGMSTLREIGAALTRFRASGKEVIAYGDAMDQRGYFLAAHADRVYVHPEGAVLLEGIARYRTYYKNAFDKFGVEARLFRVGEYKSAGEPYIRSDQSPDAREADQYWMGDIWQRYLADVATLRKLDAARLAADIEGLVDRLKAAEGNLAQLALDGKLVDALKTRDEVRAELIAAGAEDEENHTFRQVALDDYLVNLDRSQLPSDKPVIAVVVAEGEIVDGDQPPGTVGGDSTAKLVREAREDENVRALVLRVDSPGGGVFPSEVIRREVELTRAAGKPVVVSMGDVAASGGYWISMNADEIIASPSTVTGSIGIYGLWFNVPQALGKIGLTTDGSGTTWLSGAFDPTRAYDPRVGEVIQAVIDRGYRQFIGKVGEARGKAPEEIDGVARGRVWTGAQAKERGLVDTLGSLQDAIASAATRANLGGNWQLRYVEKELTPFQRFMVDLSQSRAQAFLAAHDFAIGRHFLPERTAGELAALKRLIDDAARHKPVAIYAHCECAAF